MNLDRPWNQQDPIVFTTGQLQAQAPAREVTIDVVPSMTGGYAVKTTGGFNGQAATVGQANTMASRYAAEREADGIVVSLNLFEDPVG